MGGGLGSGWGGQCRWDSRVQSASTNRAVGSSHPLAASQCDSNSGGEREIQRTMLELLNQLGRV